MQRLRRAFEPLIGPLLHFYWRFSRAATLGVRAMVIDGTGRIFLVKHSYVDGWHLPGGGVETGETLRTALARELAEEGNIHLTAHAAPARHFFQQAGCRGAITWRLFIVREFLKDGPPPPNREIIAHGFFALDALAGRHQSRHARTHRRSVRRRGGERIVVIPL